MAQKRNIMRKFILDMGPLALFFIIYNRWDLMAATAALIVATLISLAVTYIYEKKVHMAPLTLTLTCWTTDCWE